MKSYYRSRHSDDDYDDLHYYYYLPKMLYHCRFDLRYRHHRRRRDRLLLQYPSFHNGNADGDEDAGDEMRNMILSGFAGFVAAVVGGNYSCCCCRKTDPRLPMPIGYGIFPLRQLLHCCYLQDYCFVGTMKMRPWWFRSSSEFASSYADAEVWRLRNAAAVGVDDDRDVRLSLG